MLHEISDNQVKRIDQRKILSWLKGSNTVIVFIVMFISCTLLTRNFLTMQNIMNLLKQNAGIGIMAIGMLLVILIGGIDLSVGSICGFCNVLVAVLLTNLHMGLTLSIIITFIVGIVMGSINGFFVSVRRLPPFVVTLAMMSVGRGFAYIVSKGSPIIVREASIKDFGTGFFLGLPKQIWITIAVFIIVMLILRYTAYGRIIKAIGSNEEAVSLSGIRVKAYQFSVYSIIGFFAAIGGILGTSRTGVGSPLIGVGYELDAIAMVVIGGASLKGGRGSAAKTVFGVFIMGMISNIMNLTNVPAYTQQVIQGLIILVAVLFQSDRQSKVAK